MSLKNVHRAHQVTIATNAYLTISIQRLVVSLARLAMIFLLTTPTIDAMRLLVLPVSFTPLFSSVR